MKNALKEKGGLDMFCTNCGSKLPDDAVFCPECGAQVILDDAGHSNDTDKNMTDLSGTDLSENDEKIPEEIPEGERTVVLKEEDGLDTGNQDTGEQTIVLKSDPEEAGFSSEPQNQDTVFLGNSQNAAYDVTEKIASGIQDIPGDDTQAVFNDIQESLAHSDIDFEHQGDGQWNGNSGFGTNGEYGSFDNGNMGNIPNEPYMAGADGNGQKPKQQKKFWLILGLVSGGAVIAAVVIAMVIMFTPSESPSREYTEQIKQGEEYLSSSNYDDAIEAFREAIQIDENQEDAYVGLADAYIKNQEYRKAAEVLQQGSRILGNTDKIQEKKDELYEAAPELESEFETEEGKTDSSQTQNPQASVSQAEGSQTPTASGTEAGGTQTENSGSSGNSDTSSGTSDDGNVSGTSGSSAAETETSGSGETVQDSSGGEDVSDSSGSDGETSEIPGEDDSSDNEIFTMGSFKYQMQEYYKEQTLSDGSLASYIQMTYPYFVDDTEAAQTLNSYFETWITTLDNQEQAQYTGEEDLTFPVYTKISVEMTYGENGFVSMKYVTETYDGQSDPAVNYTGLIFNGSDGQQLAWSDVLYGTEDHLKELMTQYYDPSANNDLPAEEYLSKVSENLNNAYMTADGICFIAYGDAETPDLEVLIPFSESSWFKFLSDTDPSQSVESETETTAEGYSWIVEPSMEFEDVAVIIDDTVRTQWVVSDQFPLAVYKKDGKLGFINYEGTTLTEPIYNCVYSCVGIGDSYTLFASLAGNSIWSATAVDLETGQASGDTHGGHDGSDTVTVYCRGDQTLYNLFIDNSYSIAATGTGSVQPIPVVDDITQADFEDVIDGNTIYGLCSADGTVDESILYDRICFPSSGRMVARSGDKYGVIDEAGNVIIPFEYEGASYLDIDAMNVDSSSVVMTQDSPYPYSEGYIALKKDGMWGYFDVNGVCVTGMVFEDARPLNQNKAFVKQNGLWGIVEITAS